jgi:hypothetical protein
LRFPSAGARRNPRVWARLRSQSTYPGISSAPWWASAPPDTFFYAQRHP